MQHSFAGLALHTWTLDTTPLGVALDAARQAGFDAVELRRLDFKRCFDGGMTNEQVLDLVRESGMKVCALGVEYGWMFASGEESERLFGVFRETCRNAVALGCDHLMSATGQNTGTVADAIPRVRTAGDIAAEFGLKLSIEVNSQHPVVNSVEVAREIVGGAGKANVGLLLDAYHLHRSGRIGRAFEDVPADEIMYVQYSDVPAEPAAGVSRPTDRLPPGRGVVPWTEVFQLLAEKGYAGYLSYEAPNPAQWERPPHEVAAEGAAATRALLAQAFQRHVA
jgi:2-keto-myo-inositol isomerase